MWHDVGDAECDAILEGAVRYLVDGNELAAASQLLSATISARFYHDPLSEPANVFTYYVTVSGPRALCDALANEGSDEYKPLLKALCVALCAVGIEFQDEPGQPPQGRRLGKVRPSPSPPRRESDRAVATELKGCS